MFSFFTMKDIKLILKNIYFQSFKDFNKTLSYLLRSTRNRKSKFI